MQKYRASNKHLYVLLAYDTYSKLLQGVPLLDRKPPGIIKGLRTFLDGPIGIQTIYWDKEGSFLSRACQRFLKSVGVHNYTTTSQVKAPGVERVIRTIRSAVVRFFHHNKTQRWEKFLPRFIHSYNNRLHSSTRQRPVDLINNPLILPHQDTNPSPRPVILPPVGSFVRLNRIRNMFDKESTGTWTTEVYRVTAHKLMPRSIPMIKVEDLAGEPVIGALYPQEYQQIFFDVGSREIAHVFQTQRQRGQKTRYLVSFVGFPSSYRAWVTDKLH